MISWIQDRNDITEGPAMEDSCSIDGNQKPEREGRNCEGLCVFSGHISNNPFVELDTSLLVAHSHDPITLFPVIT